MTKTIERSFVIESYVRAEGAGQPEESQQSAKTIPQTRAYLRKYTLRDWPFPRASDQIKNK